MRGGYRKNAGRPATGRTTKTIRVPLDFDLNKAIELMALYEDFKMRSQDSKTSPRWEQFNNFIKEFES